MGKTVIKLHTQLVRAGSGRTSGFLTLSPSSTQKLMGQNLRSIPGTKRAGECHEDPYQWQIKFFALPLIETFDKKKSIDLNSIQIEPTSLKAVIFKNDPYLENTLFVFLDRKIFTLQRTTMTINRDAANQYNDFFRSTKLTTLTAIFIRASTMN